MNRICLEFGRGDRYLDETSGNHDGYASDEKVRGKIVIASPDNIAHIKAIRLRDGERVEFISFDSAETSRLFFTVFRGARGKKEYLFDVEYVKALEAEKPVIHLYQAKTKGAKLDFVAQRAVEAGASRIVFCDTEYSEKSGNIKIDRLRKIATEAALQCKASVMPVIETGIELRNIDFSGYDRVFFFYENASHKISALGGAERIAIIIGSEGGFSESEANWAEENFGGVYSLGSRVYRAETASIAALALVWHESGR